MRKFLYYILKEDGRSADVVNEVVTYGGNRTPLKQTPDGWQDLQIGWKRDLKDHGVIRNFTLPFGFVLDGAKIIRQALYGSSIEEKIFLLIQMLKVEYSGTYYNYFYKYLYKGEIDLSAADDAEDMVSVPCIEGDLYKLLKANRATRYTFPFDKEAVTIEMTGIPLQENAKYTTGGTISNAVFNNTHTLPVIFINKEGISSGTAFFTQQIEDVANKAVYVSSSLNYSIINDSGQTQTYKIQGKVKYIITKNDINASYRWFLTKNNNTDIDIYNSADFGALSIGATNEINIDYSFTLNNGERAFLIGRYFGSFVGGSIEVIADFIEGSVLNISFESTFKTTYIKGYKKSTLLKKIVKEVAGSESFASSQLCLDNDYIIVTSEDAIRGIENATITTSLNDFYSDMDATFMAGLGIDNGKIEIERRQKYYDFSNPIDLGEIKDFKKTPATDIICNKFKFGHIKPDIEDINGKLDPNGSIEMTGPITKVVNEYNMVSPYKAGPYEIESLRLNLNGKDTTDDRRNQSVYVINCLPQSPITTEVGFNAALKCIFINSTQGFFKGQQIQIEGSQFNDGIHVIADLGSLLVTQCIFLEGPVFDDNAVVTITVLSGQVLTINRPAYTTLEGVPNAGIFNLPKLTPKAMAKAHGPWIRSICYGLDDKNLVFNSGDKNTKLLTVLGGITVDEDSDEAIPGLGEKMFHPFYFTFGTKVPIDLVDVLELSPNRCFKFTDEDGDEFTGIMFNAGIAPNDSKEQEFRLLSAPTNNLNLLSK